MVGTIRALRQTNLQTPGTMTFVATVGEEGLGDLRGVKQLFKETLAGEIDRFVSIDGTGLGVTNVGVGSLRYRVTFKGRAATASPRSAWRTRSMRLGRAIAKIADFQVAGRAEDDLQRRPGGRRHVGELDPVRGLDGSRHAVVGAGGARGARREVPEGDRRGRRRRERPLAHAAA